MQYQDRIIFLEVQYKCSWRSITMEHDTCTEAIRDQETSSFCRTQTRPWGPPDSQTVYTIFHSSSTFLWHGYLQWSLELNILSLSGRQVFLTRGSLFWRRPLWYWSQLRRLNGQETRIVFDRYWPLHNEDLEYLTSNHLTMYRAGDCFMMD